MQQFINNWGVWLVVLAVGIFSIVLVDVLADRRRARRLRMARAEIEDESQRILSAVRRAQFSARAGGES